MNAWNFTPDALEYVANFGIALAISVGILFVLAAITVILGFAFAGFRDWKHRREVVRMYRLNDQFVANAASRAIHAHRGSLQRKRELRIVNGRKLRA